MYTLPSSPGLLGFFYFFRQEALNQIFFAFDLRLIAPCTSTRASALLASLIELWKKRISFLELHLFGLPLSAQFQLCFLCALQFLKIVSDCIAVASPNGSTEPKKRTKRITELRKKQKEKPERIKSRRGFTPSLPEGGLLVTLYTP